MLVVWVLGDKSYTLGQQPDLGCGILNNPQTVSHWLVAFMV